MSSVNPAERFSVLVILRREYLDITGNFCAAKLIEYFRHWTNWKIKNHRTSWVYQPLKKIYTDLMGEHSLYVIRRAIALLEEMGIIEKQKNPGNGQDRTWQYKLNFDVLNRLLELGRGKTEHSRFTVEQHHRSHPEASKPQQHVAAEERKSEMEETEILEYDQEREQIEIVNYTPEPEQTEIVNYDREPIRQTPEPEQPQISRFVDEQEQDDSTNDKDHHEDELSKAVVKADLNVSKQEIAEVCNELRRLRINPQPCLGVIKKHWENVKGAIAYVKDAVAEGWCTNPTGLFINSCKSGTKGKNTVTADVSAWFEWARRQRIVLAMSGGVVYTVDGEAVELREMMRRFPGGGVGL
ncbi:hypothetical protein NIES21_60950 (plasmid) [Anabaenopsis circularis NIES-21]|uniref:Replication protein O n=1 Tax=Anabaenopsis circularis NIES-21 TaxID=1085406 RepID=A0A1Z4GRT6_9CYAN|nr:hypothetical protein NIES21_60950 [Anabaenopsis circularis NIES-21]